MAQPYVGEIRMFAGTFAPAGWAFCDGRPMPISEHEVLFQLIGTMYGGDGQETFNLPNLQGRLPMHVGTNFPQAQSAGTEEVTLTVQQLPGHTHPLVASTAAGTTPSPSGSVLAASGSSNVFRAGPAPGTATLSTQTVGPAGGSQPHTNLQPYLCVNFIISLFGIFPTQT
jgi:microcystin-dependent protein